MNSSKELLFYQTFLVISSAVSHIQDVLVDEFTLQKMRLNVLSKGRWEYRLLILKYLCVQDLLSSEKKTSALY